MPLFTPPAFAASAGPRALRATSPAAGIYNAESELLRTKRALTNGADPSSPLVAANRATGRNLIETSNPAFPARAAATGAKRRLISEAGVQNNMTRNYYQQAAGLDAEAEAERQGIVGAQQDVPDLTAVAQATGHRNAVNRLRDDLGIPRDIEINVPQGTTGLPVGVAPALRSNAEYLTDKSKVNEGARNYKKSALKSAIDLEGTNLSDLRNASELAGINLEEATAGAGYADKRSGQDLADYLDQLKYGQDSAALDLADERLGPAGYDLWQDPENPGVSEYISKAEKDKRDYAYSLKQGYERLPSQIDLANQRANLSLPSQYAQSQARTQYAAQQGGLGGLSPDAALAMLQAGTLGPTGLTEQDIYNALTKAHGYSPNAAYGLVTQAKSKSKVDAPLASFDESDMVAWLSKDFDAWEANPLSQVRAELTRRYPNNPETVQIKLQQLIDTAKRAKAAKAKQAAGSGYSYGGSSVPSPPSSGGGGFTLGQ